MAEAMLQQLVAAYWSEWSAKATRLNTLLPGEERSDVRSMLISKARDRRDAAHRLLLAMEEGVEWVGDPIRESAFDVYFPLGPPKETEQNG
jgi:hypothetical protein